MLLPGMVCLCCKHYIRIIEEPNGRERHVCQAYQYEIPRSLLYLSADHRQPFHNDNGFRFEMNPEKEEYRHEVESQLKQVEEMLAERQQLLERSRIRPDDSKSNE